MASRRMFAKQIIECDAFLDMPHSTQLLYFHLGMQADDDGFLDNYNSVIRNVKCNTDDLKLLIAKGFLIAFESGVVVIRDWRINNQIRKDRYHPTRHRQEWQQLKLLSNEQYALVGGCQNGNQMATESSLAKPSQAKPSIVKESVLVADDGVGAPVFIPSRGEIKAYCDEIGIEIDVELFYNYYASRGWHINGKPVQSWTALVKCWHARDAKYKGQQSTLPTPTNPTEQPTSDTYKDDKVGKVI